MQRHTTLRVAAIAISACLAGCTGEQAETASSTRDAARVAPNFIVLIGDDMAVETLDCYGIGKTTAVTPTLDSLCSSGIRFDNFWAQPVCSPTRATILSGRYGFRTGVGVPASSGIPSLPVPGNPDNRHIELRGGGPYSGGMGMGADTPSPGLRADEFTLPMALKADPQAGYVTAAFGKWHLADQANGGINHPNLAGFDHYAGSVRSGGVESYYSWSKVVNGEVTAGSSTWADSDKVDDAITWLGQRNDEAPWLLWLAFNAPHTPFHLPPLELLNSEAKMLDPDGITADNQHAYYNAMIEAMDTEIGRLLQHLDAAERARTYILFLGDNGTPEQVAKSPFDFTHSKGSIRQGGINVPFIVAGPGIKPGLVSKSLANSVDIYATLLDLAGIDIDDVVPPEKKIDAVSLVPVLENGSAQVRGFAYADVFGGVPRGVVDEKTIRDSRYKLFVAAAGEELYDLENDPYETDNLLGGELSEEDRQHYLWLRSRLDELLKSGNQG